MFFSPIIFLSYLFIFISTYFIGIIFLSKSRKAYLGSILPIICLCISICNFLKPMLIYNPHPTMREGVYMTFFGGLSIVGFITFAIVRYRSRRDSKEEGL